MMPNTAVDNNHILPDRIHRELRKGETIYHSSLPCYVSKKYPNGKWVGQVRREERGRLIKYPVKGFGTPKEALDYVASLRPNAKGRVYSPRQGEPTVSMLYDFVKQHRQKRIGEQTKDGKESRWRMYIEPAWGDCPISMVTRRAAQEWVTEVESKIEAGRAGTLGLAQFEKVRTDLHALFDSLDSFSPDFEDRKNPFAGLEFTARPPRSKVTIESGHFPAIYHACQVFAAEKLCTEWIAEMFLTALFAGLREGEVMALCLDQIDFENGAIIIDRALRKKSRAIDPKSRLETGAVLRQAMNLPKRGTPTNNKTRVVPMSEQLSLILSKAINRKSTQKGDWDLLWPSETGQLRQLTRFRSAWKTLRNRLDEVAKFGTPNILDGQFAPVAKRRGWTQNELIYRAQQTPQFRLPDIFGQDVIDFRDTRNSFASYMNERGLSQATREHFLGHGGDLTNSVYTTVTSVAFHEARECLSVGWNVVDVCANQG